MKAKFVTAVYERSDSFEHQGNRDSIKKYQEKGYYPQENRNGYWVLVKPARVLVTIKSEEERKTFNMKQDICEYYGKQRISEKIFNRFCDDARNGKIKFTLDSGSYTLN